MFRYLNFGRPDDDKQFLATLYALDQYVLPLKDLGTHPILEASTRDSKGLVRKIAEYFFAQENQSEVAQD